jgi:hypothetical protein
VTPPYATLRKVGDVTQKALAEAIAENLRAYFEWGFLNAGGFVEVPVSTPGTDDPYADETLYPVHLEGAADNTIWESEHTSWVYETGLDPSPPPTVASGVYVDGTFYPTAPTTGAFAHYVDFSEGRVVFASPIAATSVVQAAYAYKWVNVYGQDVPWFRDVVFDALLVESQPTGDGFVKLLDEHRVMLPAVIVEVPVSWRQRPLMIGSTAQWVSQDVLFHVLARRADERNNILDAIRFQKDEAIYLFDVNARRAAGDYPLDWHGSPASGASTYPNLVAPAPDGYRWKKAFFGDMVGQDVSLRLPLYRGIVRATLEVDFGGM